MRNNNTYIQEKLKELKENNWDSPQGLMTKTIITTKKGGFKGYLTEPVTLKMVESYLTIALQDAIKYGEGRMIKLLREEHPNACLCYKYKTPDGVWHLIQCDKCGGKLTEIRRNENNRRTN